MKHDYGKGMSYDKKSSSSSSGAGSGMKGGSKTVKAGKGTIRTPFTRAIIRDIGRRP